ncbi:unnamed protein product, partial [Didymodactylos carnosus]
LKLDFIRIVCSHEHYITLNLPFNPAKSANSTTTSNTASSPPTLSPSPSVGSIQSFGSSSHSTQTEDQCKNQTDLSYEYRQQHYLTGIVLQDLAKVLTLSSHVLHGKAINTLRNLLTSHDFDGRLTSQECRSRVAHLYLPLVNIVTEHLTKLFDPGNASFGQLNRPSFVATDDPIDVTMSQINNESHSNDEQQQADGTMRRILYGEETSKDLLICFLWLLKNSDKLKLKHWWSKVSRLMLTKIIHLLDLCTASFEYKGKKCIRRYRGHVQSKKANNVKIQLEEAIMGTQNARTELLLRRRNTNVQEVPKGNLRWRKDQTHWRQTNIDIVRSEDEISAEAHIESNLASECTMIILDTIETVIQVVQTTDCHQILLPGLLRILLHSFALNQSTWILQNLFSHQRAMVYKFPELLFEEDTEQCADLCLRLLKHCSSCLSTIRSHASASLYLLMRQNFEIGNNFSRVKMQVTMSLSWLVGQSQAFNEIFLRKSLRTILTYAEGDTELQDTAFPSQ